MAVYPSHTSAFRVSQAAIPLEQREDPEKLQDNSPTFKFSAICLQRDLMAHWKDPWRKT